MSVSNLDVNGACIEDETLLFESAYADYDEADEFAGHAPSEFVAWCRDERTRRRMRDLTDLQDAWRDEEQRRKRERAFTYYRNGAGKWRRA